MSLRKRRKFNIPILMTTGVLGGGGVAVPLPKQIANNIFYIDAAISGNLYQDSAGATPAAADNDVVGRWNDLSASSANATQSTTANKLTLKTGIQNGLPIVRGDGVSDYLSASLNINPASIPNITFSYVYARRAVGAHGVMGCDSGGWKRAIFTDRVSNGSTGVSFVSPPAIGTFAVITVIMQQGVTNGSFVYINGSLDLTFTSNHTAGDAAMSLFRNGSSGLYGNLDLGELAIYSGVLSTEDRQVLEAYYAARWSI